MQINKSLLRSLSVKTALFWGRLLKRMLLNCFHWERSHGRFWSGGFSYCCVQKRAHYISFSPFQMPCMFSFFLFLVEAHFRCSTWIGLMAHSHLLFSRLLFSSELADEECFQWCKSMRLRPISQSIPISIQIGVIKWLISQLQDLFIVPDTRQNVKIGWMQKKFAPCLK